MSHIGQQYFAPRGWCSLIPGRRYHFLSFVKESGLVRFVWFSEKPRAAHLEHLQYADFESGIDRGLVVLAHQQMALPPWLSHLEGQGADLSTLHETLPPARQAKRKKTFEEEVRFRTNSISTLLNNAKDLLARPNLLQGLNQFARKQNPAQNEARTRLWFFLMCAFGFNKWSLLPGRKTCGRKAVRDAGPGDFGRNSSARGRYARPQMTPEIGDLIVESWKKITSGKRRKLSTVVSLITSEGFGAKARRCENGTTEYYHPSGMPLPTENQILYVLKNRIGKVQMQIALYGAPRVRNRLKASRGSYSQYIVNLLEKVEADAYVLADVPSSPLDGQQMPSLIVVRIRDSGSGMLVGIGFSIGGEKAQAYAMALFSMALPKQHFCKLFGLEIDPEDWPCQGLPGWAVYDRGPGGAPDLIKRFEDKVAIRTLAPSYSGQSKAVVESSHPRKRASDGSPTSFHTSSTYVELAKREILRLIADNKRMDVASRLTPAMLRAGVFCSPLSIWNYLDRRCRTSAQPMSLESAISNFLEPHTFKIDGDGAHFMHMTYRSDDLLKTGVCDLAETGGVIEVQGYAPAISMRGAWLKIQNKFVRVEMCIKIQDDERQLYLSLSELEELSKIRSRLRSQSKQNALAVETEMRDRFKESTGKDWDGGVCIGKKASRKRRADRVDAAIVKSVLRA